MSSMQPASHVLHGDSLYPPRASRRPQAQSRCNIDHRGFLLDGSARRRGGQHEQRNIGIVGGIHHLVHLFGHVAKGVVKGKQRAAITAGGYLFRVNHKDNGVKLLANGSGGL
eukprot:TRINITY_DN11555_c4_g3_i1.p5 TRINITY_DN11555_c4_g3~~TRINITY_DN11555_c4_g3_i1.p5  ORF type:complete len:112 (-),score=19.66 TRINITY_DN11555_c4_g3_i1:1123-1458(-)